MTAVAVLAVILVGSASAATNWGRDSLGEKYLVYTDYLTGGGPMCFRMMNTSATDTLNVGEVVGFDTTSLTVITLYNVGAAVDTPALNAVAYVTSGDIDSMLGTRDWPPTGFPRYDTAKAGQWKMRAVWRSPGAGAGDTKYVYIKYRPTTSEPMKLLSFRTVGVGNFDTCFSNIAARIESVFVTGIQAADSFALYVEPVGGVKVNTVLDTADFSACYAGVAREVILPRRRGLIQYIGPAQVKINAVATDIKNGYWLSPSAVAGYAVATDTAPFIPIGRVVSYEQDDATQSCILSPPMLGGWSFLLIWADFDTINAGLDSAQAEIDSVKAGLDSAQAEIDSVKLDVATSAAGIDSLQAEADSIDARVDTAYAGIDSLQAEADSIDARVDTAYAGIDSLQAGLDSAQAEIDSVRAEIELSGTPLWRTTFRAGSFVIAPDSGPALIQADSSNFSWDALAFDQTAQEQAYILDCVEGYTLADTADSVHILIAWTSASASTDTVKWLVDFVARGDGQLFDSTLGLGGFMADANQGTGVLNIVEASYSVTVCGIDDILSFSIGRDPSVAANLAADAQLVMVRFTYFKASVGYEE